MSKVTVILDEFYPFIDKETFLETEIKYHNERTYIFPLSAYDGMPMREVPTNVTFFSRKKQIEIIRKLKKVISYMRVLFRYDTIQEIKRLRYNKKLNTITLKRLLSFVSCAIESFEWVRSELLVLGFDKESNFTVYSYWMHFHAYTAVLLKRDFKNIKICTRCHRFDLYENIHSYDYLPMRKCILTNMDTIFAISNDAREYIEQRYQDVNPNIKISRLGTANHSFKINISKDNFKIVSCSWVVPVKTYR